MKISRRCLLPLILIETARGEEGSDNEQNYLTALCNGREWRQMGEAGRAFYLRGMYDGASYAIDKYGALAMETANLKFVDLTLSLNGGMVSKGTGLDELYEGVTKFYREPANLGISVMEAVRLYILKVKGASAAEIEKKVAELRHAAVAKPRGQ